MVWLSASSAMGQAVQTSAQETLLTENVLCSLKKKKNLPAEVWSAMVSDGVRRRRKFGS